MVENRLVGLIDMAICPENQESGEATAEPAIVSHRKHSAFVLIERILK